MLWLTRKLPGLPLAVRKSVSPGCLTALGAFSFPADGDRGSFVPGAGIERRESSGAGGRSHIVRTRGTGKLFWVRC